MNTHSENSPTNQLTQQSILPISDENKEQISHALNNTITRKEKSDPTVLESKNVLGKTNTNNVAQNSQSPKTKISKNDQAPNNLSSSSPIHQHPQISSATPIAPNQTIKAVPTSTDKPELLDNTPISSNIRSNENANLQEQLVNLPSASILLDLSTPDVSIYHISASYKIEVLKKKRTPNVVVGLYYAPSISQNDIRGDRPAIIPDDQLGYNFGNFGVKAELQLTSRFAIETGLQRTQLRMRSNYDVTFPYLRMDEHTNARGNFDNEFSHTLPSLYGNVNTLMALTRLASHDVPDGEDVNVTWLLNQKAELLKRADCSKILFESKCFFPNFTCRYC